MHTPCRAITTPTWDVGGLGDLLGNNKLGMFGSNSLFSVFSDALGHFFMRSYAIASRLGECLWQKQSSICACGLVRSVVPLCSRQGSVSGGRGKRTAWASHEQKKTIDYMTPTTPPSKVYFLEVTAAFFLPRSFLARFLRSLICLRDVVTFSASPNLTRRYVGSNFLAASTLS